MCAERDSPCGGSDSQMYELVGRWTDSKFEALAELSAVEWGAALHDLWPEMPTLVCALHRVVLRAGGNLHDTPTTR